jgi:dienelactone hydrolase
MKYLFLLLIPFSTTAQKPVIDSAAINRWVSLGNDDDVAVSNDGKYVAYSIRTQFNTVVVQSTVDNWKQIFPDASAGFFSIDSKQYIFRIKDTLCFFNLVTHQTKQIPGVAESQSWYEAKGEWTYWRQADTLVLHHLSTGKENRYSSVKAYVFNKNRSVVLLKTQAGLQLADKIISADTTIEGYATDHSGTQVVFIKQGQLWYYKTGMDKPVLKVNDHAFDLQIKGSPRFSDNGQYIFFSLYPAPIPKPSPNAVKLDVWSYKDMIIQSLQLADPKTIVYTAVIGVEDKRPIRLRYDHEISKIPPTRDYMIFGKNTMGDRFWLNLPDSNWLVSLKDGSRQLLSVAARELEFRSSPAANYIICFNPGNYFTYNLSTGKSVNISAGIIPDLATEDRYKIPVERYSFPVGIAGWLPEDKGVLVYDNYDIWQLDPAGIRPPVNITNGYGRLHHIKFRLANDGEDIVVSDSSLLLIAYNTINKQTGFFRTSIKNPLLLTMGPYVYSLQGRNLYAMNDHDFDKGMKPLKAIHADLWVVKRQSATEAPNYFITSDFKTYKALTNLQPQQAYNWLSAELVEFTQLDGTKSQGVLYKPENFDPTKKYPVLLNYYEQMGQRLYQFPTPDFTRHNIDVGWFVSHGYLVFTPDIYFDKKRTGKSALNAVAGAGLYLSKRPYVDAKRMGINGHSSGGFLTNYIITHTHLFAAAIEGAGTSDIVSSAFQLSNGSSRLYVIEEPKGLLWKNKALWLEESPILKADRITTPLIIFHSKSDGAVPWEQAVELFVALRRLNKKAWLLQYDEGNHGVWNKRDYEDYTIRITQFFDHYLKGSPAPKWMTQGISSGMKGIDNGLELDLSGNQP